MNITYNGSNKKELKIDGVLALKAANGEGESLITSIYDFSKNNTVKSKKLLWVENQKAWFNTLRNSLVLFNIAGDSETFEKAKKLVKEFVEQEPKQVFTITTGGVTTTDEGVVLATDSGKALQLHESKEKNVAKK